MKQILSLFAIGVLFVCASCNSDKTETAGETTTEKKENSMAEKNLAAFNAVSKAFETGEVGGLDSLIAPDFVDHTERGDKKGVDSLKAAIAWAHADSKDMKIEAVKVLADDEYVIGWQRFTGTSNGGMGKPGPYDMKSMEVVKFKDGKAVEHWAFIEMRDAMEMMSHMVPVTEKKK